MDSQHCTSPAWHAGDPSTKRGRKIRSLRSSSVLITEHFETLPQIHTCTQTIHAQGHLSPQQASDVSASLSLGSPGLRAHTSAGAEEGSHLLVGSSSAPCPALQGSPLSGAVSMKVMEKFLSRRMQMCPAQAGQMERLLGKESTGHE